MANSERVARYAHDKKDMAGHLPGPRHRELPAGLELPGPGRLTSRYTPVWAVSRPESTAAANAA